MTREQFLQLKEELKELARNIRLQKAARKSTAQAFSKFERENYTFNDYYYRRIRDNEWLPIRDEYEKLYRDQLAAMMKADSLRQEYRLKHVVYCLARGRTMREIESNNRQGNHLDIIPVNRMARKYNLQWPPHPVKA